MKTLIVGTADSQDGTDEAGTLARNVQTELRRLGCYRLEVDGDWGGGSVKALTDYYRNRKQPGGSTQPSLELLSDLFLQSGRVCKQPVIIKKKESAGTRLVSDDGDTSGAKGKRQSAKKTKRAPAAPPPDISGGIGIGGIF